MSPLAEKWARCQQPDCTAPLHFNGTREERLELADRGDLQGFCPIHANQSIPWAMQTEIAEAIADSIPARLPERISVKRATHESSTRKPAHRCVLLSAAQANG